MHKWYVYDDLKAASAAAADRVAELIQAAIEEKAICHVVLPGGHTPTLCLSYLSKKALPWNQVHWYLGDERCCSSGHEDRNDVMLQNNLWSKMNDTNKYPIPAEFGAAQAAKKYREIIDNVDQFDIAFLGVGEDGHTASLFPGNSALDDTQSVVPVYDAPKPPDDRVSLSVNTLKHAKKRIALTSGEEKAEMVKQVKSGDPLPINILGDIAWYVDAAASGSEK